MKIVKQLELKNYTTLHIGGTAEEAFFPESKEEVIDILKNKHPLILGNGSNVLIDDRKTFETVMILKDFRSIHQEGTNIICDAGISLKEVCLFALKQELTGLEFAFGIPGSAGGAIVMNAGAYGGEMKDVVQSVVAYDRQEKMIEKEDLDFNYRHSYFSDTDDCVLEITFHLKKGNFHEIQSKMNDYMNQRQSKQPLDQHSAGSTFKRGFDFYASALINQCNLKGLSVNEASVSTKHAGFLINQNNATFDEFMTLICLVQTIVENQTGKRLELEVKIIQ